jgi:hypothetical protein
MNLCISLSKIKSFLNSPEENAYFIFFMERKRNIIMDGGYFTKISISNSFFTMNGIYTNVTITQKPPDDSFYGSDVAKTKYDQMHYTIQNEPSVSSSYSTPQNSTKYYIYFDPYTLSNRTNTESIIQLEETILQMYGVLCPSKTPIYTLKNQLHNGVFKIHQSFITHTLPNNEHITLQNKYTLKISGVWENAHNYGITYKCTL